VALQNCANTAEISNSPNEINVPAFRVVSQGRWKFGELA
jgi:hypothetical protein